MRSLLPLLVLAACTEYGVNPDLDPVETDEDGDISTCGAELADPHDVDTRIDCAPYDAGDVDNAWDLSVEWQTADGAGSVVMPAVGNLTDDNADGRVDDEDVPDIAYVGWGGFTNTLYVHAGDGSGLKWTATNFRTDAGVTIADVDADGRNDVVGITPDGRVIAYEGNGTPKWTGADTFAMLWPVTTAADLDADGRPEIIADMALVNGEDGSTIASLSNDGMTWRTPIAADLDQNGYQEIILGPNVYNHLGQLLWSASGTGTSCFDAVYQGDDDEDAEIAFAWGAELLLYEHDGTLIDAVPLPGTMYFSHPGPPCVGDIDGDGQAEIVVPSSSTITAFETDGTPIWSSSMYDGSGAAGCSVYDMDGDSVYEVLFADEQDLRIYDGRTGSVLYTNGTHQSVTYFEYPVIADVDRDGSAEIVVASSATNMGITVFGHNGSGWPAAGPTWGVHDYAFTNQNADGSLPAQPVASWLSHDVFRGRPSADRAGMPDLLVEIVDVCAAGCEDDSSVGLTYQVRNEGGTDVPAGVPLSLYADGEHVRTVSLPAVPAGEAIRGDEITFDLEDFGTGDLRLVVDDDGFGGSTLVECGEDNNADDTNAEVCE